MKNILFDIFLWIWCFPQMLLGWIIKIIFKGKKSFYQIDGKACKVYHYDCKKGSISLGKYIMLCDSHCGDFETVRHEYGHYKQSLILGWLYLIVIGLPSLLWAWFLHEKFNNFRCKKHKPYVGYYDFYTEKWANKLGGVK